LRKDLLTFFTLFTIRIMMIASLLMLLLVYFCCIAAVVALLKSAGASNKLTYLIIGEALLNDGIALVLYNLFFTLVAKDAGPVFTPVEVLVYFVRVLFISPLLGFAFGVASAVCLRYSTCIRPYIHTWVFAKLVRGRYNCVIDLKKIYIYMIYFTTTMFSLCYNATNCAVCVCVFVSFFLVVAPIC
jgi:NhaP-type Na+/H+ or K+/H+ antiporter